MLVHPDGCSARCLSDSVISLTSEEDGNVGGQFTQAPLLSLAQRERPAFPPPSEGVL